MSNHESRRHFFGDMIGNLESSGNYTSKDYAQHTPVYSQLATSVMTPVLNH